MVLVEEYHYLPPEPVVSSFAFTRGHTEYVMRLEHWGPTPSLVFAMRKWRDASPNRLLRWFRQFARLEPLTVNFKYVCELEGAMLPRTKLDDVFLSSLGFEPLLHSVLQAVRSRVIGRGS